MALFFISLLPPPFLFFFLNDPSPDLLPLLSTDSAVELRKPLHQQPFISSTRWLHHFTLHHPCLTSQPFVFCSLTLTISLCCRRHMLRTNAVTRCSRTSVSSSWKPLHDFAIKKNLPTSKKSFIWLENLNGTEPTGASGLNLEVANFLPLPDLMMFLRLHRLTKRSRVTSARCSTPDVPVELQFAAASLNQHAGPECPSTHFILLFHPAGETRDFLSLRFFGLQNRPR